MTSGSQSKVQAEFKRKTAWFSEDRDTGLLQASSREYPGRVNPLAKLNLLCCLRRPRTIEVEHLSQQGASTSPSSGGLLAARKLGRVKHPHPLAFRLEDKYSLPSLCGKNGSQRDPSTTHGNPHCPRPQRGSHVSKSSHVVDGFLTCRQVQKW
ncbi:uncharacterized protein LOC110986147 [Acanthaster planci]|uniref:Uncharacterized protein LOC110986147 n=1 Tax=Acanthaster planci TaxID=133434 RepID=A0A8B7ZCT4_ACAPL|nr:uncharacterized protein LOC110986147 [Acanthaster planci]